MKRSCLGVLSITIIVLVSLTDFGVKVQSQRPGSAESVIQTVSNVWRGLVPLRSTRTDVEKVLGAPKSYHGFTYIYHTRTERIDVLYSAGACKRSGVERWNVPLDTILTIMVTPKAKILVHDLHLDRRKYSRTQDAHPEDWVHYWNLEDGITIDAVLYKGSEEIISVTYQPKAADKTLRCDDTILVCDLGRAKELCLGERCG